MKLWFESGEADPLKTFNTSFGMCLVDSFNLKMEGKKLGAVPVSRCGEMGQGIRPNPLGGSCFRLVRSGRRKFSEQACIFQKKRPKPDSRPLIAQGLTAAVYTQTIDVEIEINGYLTNDRKMEKMGVDMIRQAHADLLKLK